MTFFALHWIVNNENKSLEFPSGTSSSAKSVFLLYSNHVTTTFNSSLDPISAKRQARHSFHRLIQNQQRYFPQRTEIHSAYQGRSLRRRLGLNTLKLVKRTTTVRRRIKDGFKTLFKKCVMEGIYSLVPWVSF